MFWIILLIWLIGLIITYINLWFYFIDNSTGVTIEDYVKFMCNKDLEMLIFFSMFPITGLLITLISFFIVWSMKLFNKIKHIKIRR